MQKFVFFFLLLCVQMPLASAQLSSDRWNFTYHPFKGQYEVYGGVLGDMQAPVEGNKKIAFKIDAAAARHMFEAMGPDTKDACSGEAGERTRIKDRLICTRSRRGAYNCYFGFDLATGKSIGGQIC
ncbi:hypothetical protein [Noviherbaspirillum aerium]|uniref:hypothetical protein n=1 Tax=Noviherbaspirillum aerium TaxID=2588497 RepID=UPI00124DBAE2|nr:hypothetical protein [Noviherbaspirillum aerium]